MEKLWLFISEDCRDVLAERLNEEFRATEFDYEYGEMRVLSLHMNRKNTQSNQPRRQVA